eukprot:TRINITY_DN48972_c0_g1_i1.p1 TRINITY_DN48972_c0_g1~~TRINITY_DN48972_c0_g1_i1.p1  ORF type:complete len:381 (-),score=109.49 TRINITY_DN48972_c0_g1_i1:7-1149(-)
MIRRPPRSTLSSSSAASDVYKRQNELWEVVGSVVDVDVGAIVVNSSVAVWMLTETGYTVKEGEALPLMSYNAISIARAHRLVVVMEDAILLMAMAAAATMKALSCDPAPFSPSTMSTLPDTPTSHWIRAAVSSLLWWTGDAHLLQPKGHLQDPLSTRCFAVCQGTAMAHLRALQNQIHHFLNTNPINPIVCPDKVSTSPFFDPIGLRLAVDAAKMAVSEAAVRCYSRMVNTLDPSHNGGLPVGLGEVHNRNLAVLASSNLVALQQAAACVGVVMPVRCADGVEDVCSGLSHGCQRAMAAMENCMVLATCELVVAFQAAKCGPRGRMEGGAMEQVWGKIDEFMERREFGRADPRKVFDLGELQHERILRGSNSNVIHTMTL